MGIRKVYTKYRVMYYPKFHCKLNYIEYFWYNRKSWTKKHCKYSIEDLGKDIPRVLTQIKRSTILGHYTSCHKKMELYREKIEYETSE